MPHQAAAAMVEGNPARNGEDYDRHRPGARAGAHRARSGCRDAVLETELWLEGVGSRRLNLLELVVPSRPPDAASPGDCGRSRPDGKMMCEQCWRHVAP